MNGREEVLIIGEVFDRFEIRYVIHLDPAKPGSTGGAAIGLGLAPAGGLDAA
jgi:hypothetical protein